LGLPAPPLPWHTERTRVAELAGALGEAAGAAGKAARDVILLAQTEVGEVREGGGGAGSGGSSTLPHKRNPIAAVSAAACAARAPALGRQAAHDAVAAAAAETVAAGRPFGEVLAARADVGGQLSPEQIAALLEPDGYLGSAQLFIDRALERHRRGGGG